MALHEQNLSGMHLNEFNGELSLAKLLESQRL